MFKIGIVGTGWSGSGALLEAIEMSGGVFKYPYEFNFFRGGEGLIYIKNYPDLRKYLFSRIIKNIKNLIKIIFKIRITIDEKKNIKLIYKITISELLICVKLIFQDISNLDITYLKSYYLRLIEESLPEQKNIFLI